MANAWEFSILTSNVALNGFQLLCTLALTWDTTQERSFLELRDTDDPIPGQWCFQGRSWSKGGNVRLKRGHFTWNTPGRALSPHQLITHCRTWQGYLSFQQEEPIFLPQEEEDFFLTQQQLSQQKIVTTLNSLSSNVLLFRRAPSNFLLFPL